MFKRHLIELAMAAAELDIGPPNTEGQDEKINKPTKGVLAQIMSMGAAASNEPERLGIALALGARAATAIVRLDCLARIRNRAKVLSANEPLAAAALIEIADGWENGWTDK